MRFSYAVAGDHMKRIVKHMQDSYDEHDVWGAAVPNFSSGGTQFGTLFSARRAAVRFADTIRKDPFRCTFAGTLGRVRPRCVQNRPNLEKARPDMVRSHTEFGRPGSDLI